MKTNIIISLELLEQSSLTPNELIYLFCLYSNLPLPTYSVDLDKLEDLKYIKVTKRAVYGRNYNIKKLFPAESLVSPSTDKRVQNIEEAWEQLIAAYPKKDGTRPLQNKSVAKKSFLRVLKTHKIEDILKGLKTQLAVRDNRSMRGEWNAAHKLLSTWLNQEVWLEYLELEEELSTPTKTNVARL